MLGNISTPDPSTTAIAEGSDAVAAETLDAFASTGPVHAAESATSTTADLFSHTQTAVFQIYPSIEAVTGTFRAQFNAVV